MSKNVAVILAGGKGVRLGYDKPKQFLKVAGRLIIEHTIDIFQKNISIEEIIVVCHKDYISLVESLVNKNSFDKVSKVINGGNERSESSLSAIKTFDINEDVNLIFHDAVRPLLNDDIINRCVDALQDYNAVDVAIPATDTIIEVENHLITKIPDRNKLMRGQTPQAFKLNLIAKAYQIAMQDKDFKATDDCGIVRKYLPNERIFVISGREANMKLTHIEDLYLLDKLFQIKSINIDNYSDLSSLKDKVLVVFGGTYGIGEEIVKIAKKQGARVYNFSRSTNNVNISNIKDVQNALESVYKNEKKIDFIVNTAGLLHKKSLENMCYEDIFEAININYTGSVIVAKESIKYLKKTNGTLLFFTSSSYTRGRANYSLYSSSKAAIVNLTQALSEEWDVFGVSVNCINPERTSTPMRTKNFGCEDPNTLLSASYVAQKSLRSLLLNISGQVLDIKVMHDV